MEELITDSSAVPTTRAGNEKKVMVYIETNGVNPLNALVYTKVSDGKPFIDIVNLFAANSERLQNAAESVKGAR